MDELTEQWKEALAARSDMHPRSPVHALDALLRANRECDVGEWISLIHSPITPQGPRGTSQGRFPVKGNRP
ncbi:hypothetical protein GCM10022403_039200 [Streptomyces coacervatus]|uniref:Uncharacterized protein n=1 Tax=Streptomyces coacervatus TaxID=647381 RepID=A0ABP7HRN6_9ACTN